MTHECPSRRNINLREDGGYESEGDEDDIELPHVGMIGVARKIMSGEYELGR